MSFSSNSNTDMGRPNHEKPPQDGVKSEINVGSNDDDGPIDLSMPRYPNRKKESRAANSYYGASRRKQPSSYDVDSNEQPIDYSKKYVESNSLSAIKTNYVPRNSLNKVKVDHREREKRFSQQDEKAYPYGDYAETDLDQPTDYSLRYAEDDTDDEEKQDDAYFNGNEQEDTVKTYCTEGTPYETPFNVSSATSMSDLRLEEAKDGDGSRRTARKIIQDVRNAKDALTKQPTVESKEEEKGETKDEEDEILTKESKNMSNELVLNSSSASIEKPVNYYDEGTPGRISRVSSLSSLGCNNGPRNEDVEDTSEQREVQTTPALPVSAITLADGCKESIEETQDSLVVDGSTINNEEIAAGCPEEEEKEESRVVDKEGKVVTFGGEDHYAEQTPLMFSRSSSLGSLSGFEQHSIHDDRSSIVSDFSRRTSGVVSPSELPDSPTQTVPPSPRHNQKNNANDFSIRAPPLRQFSYVKSPRSKSSVFEDNVTAFKEESTPIEFSAATSLSSLTIDDEPKIVMDSKEKDYPQDSKTAGRFLANASVESVENVVDESRKESVENRVGENNSTVQGQLSDGDEDDEDILAACISMGMRNSMYRQSGKKISAIPDKINNRISGEDSTTNLVRYETSSTLDRLVADVAAVSLSPNSKTKNSIDSVVVPPDTLRVYCTEDTPANISPAGSQSNLSALSMLSISGEIEKDDRNLLSDEDDDDKILDDCIRAGIARTLQGANSFPGTAAVTEFSSPSHVSSEMKSHEDEGSSSFPCTAAATKQHSPHHASSTKKPEGYLSNLADTGQSFTMSPSFSVKSNEVSNSVVDHDDLGEDDRILDDCIRAGMVKTLHEANSFPSTAAATKFNSPRHINSTRKCAGDDKLMDDSIRFGMSKNLQASNSFPGTAAATKHNSPRHVSSTKKPEAHVPRAIDSYREFSMSSRSPTKRNDPPARRISSKRPTPNSIDHDTSGDEDKILDDCIKAGIARTLRGGIAFPSNATATKHHSPRHASSTKKTEVYLSRPADTRQAFSMSSSSPSKSNAAYSRRSSSTRTNSTTVDHDTSGDDDKILDDCIRAGIARTLQGGILFPSNQASAISHQKLHSPVHVSSSKKSEKYVTRTSDNRQSFSMSSQSPTRRHGDASIRSTSSRSNSNTIDHDTSGDDDKILDDCIRAGIARTLQGVNTFPTTAPAAKVHSPRPSSSTKKSELYLPRNVDNRQVFPITSSSPVKNNDVPIGRTSSPRLNSISIDRDRILYSGSPNHSDDEAILTQCIQSAMPKACRNSLSFAKSQSSRKLENSLGRNCNLSEMSACSSTRVRTEVFRTSVTRILIPAIERADESFGDNSSLSEDEEDLMLARCIRSGMPRSLSMPPKETNYHREERRTREQ